jgi:acetyl esterase/lipase
MIQQLIIPADGVRITRDIAYGNEARQKLDVYVPQGHVRGTIVYFYGGSWRNGDRALYRFMGAGLASRGYTVVVPDYRLHPEVRFPSFVEDAARAVRWTERNIEGYGGTLERVFLMGHSAGAHIALLLTLDPAYFGTAGVAPDRIRAVIGVAGPYTFNPLDYVTTRPVFRTAANDIDRARPIKLVDGPIVPLLLLHGEDDKTVGVHNSRNFAKALEAVGSPVTLRTYPRLGHLGILSAYAWPLRWRAPVLEDTMRFLEAQ